MKIAILGFGTVGSGVYEMLDKKDLGVKVTRVLDLRDFECLPNGVLTKDFKDILNDDEITCVVETMGGTGFAYTCVKECLLAGKNVVTSNKNLVAEYGPELQKIADDKNIKFLYEAAVGGAIPIIRGLNESLATDNIISIKGILNGTTNYILTQMGEKGQSFEEALKDAQALGYAEADPTSDVEGHDTCRKIAILGSIMTGEYIDYKTLPCEGITKVTKADIDAAKAEGKLIKLIGCCEYKDGKAHAYVRPEKVDKDNILYAVNDVYNAVMVDCEYAGPLMFYGRGAGHLPTASAVVADILHTK